MKQRKIYYVPGMISLIFLPILCVWYLNKHKNIERCFEVSYAQKYNKGAENHRFDTTMLALPEYKRQYLEVSINNSDVDNNNAFAIIQSKLDQILRNKNKQLGIHIIFSDDSKYDSYIRTIDILENSFKAHSVHHTYCPYNNNIWVFYYIDANKVSMALEHHYKYIEYPLSSELDIKNDRLKLYIILISIFVLFTGLSLYYTINNLTKNKTTE